MRIYSFVSENQYGCKSREWKHKHRFLNLFFDFIPAVPVALAANRTVKRWLASSWAAIALFKTRPCSLNRRTAGILTSSLFPSSFDMANMGCVSLELPSTLSAAQKKKCSVAESCKLGYSEARLTKLGSKSPTWVVYHRDTRFSNDVTAAIRFPPRKETECMFEPQSNL